MLKVFRKEMKYVVPVESAFKLINSLDCIMQRDQNGQNGLYTVRSQYFDSFVNRDLHDNLDGLMEKRKIRIRTYSPEAEEVKLEYKCKSGSDSLKCSVWISREEALQIENHQFDCLLDHEGLLPKQLYLKMTQNFYRPKSIIEYERLAFMYPISNVRITFDTEINGTVNPYGLFDKEPFFIPLLAKDRTIMEVKYDDFIPTQIKKIIASVENIQQGFSKYLASRTY